MKTRMLYAWTADIFDPMHALRSLSSDSVPTSSSVLARIATESASLYDLTFERQKEALAELTKLGLKASGDHLHSEGNKQLPGQIYIAMENRRLGSHGSFSVGMRTDYHRVFYLTNDLNKIVIVDTADYECAVLSAQKISILEGITQEEFGAIKRELENKNRGK